MPASLPLSIGITMLDVHFLGIYMIRSLAVAIPVSVIFVIIWVLAFFLFGVCIFTSLGVLVLAVLIFLVLVQGIWVWGSQAVRTLLTFLQLTFVFVPIGTFGLESLEY